MTKARMLERKQFAASSTMLICLLATRRFSSAADGTRLRPMPSMLAAKCRNLLISTPLVLRNYRAKRGINARRPRRIDDSALVSVDKSVINQATSSPGA